MSLSRTTSIKRLFLAMTCKAFGTFKDPPADARFASKILKTTWGSSLVNKFHRYVQQTSTRGKLF